VLYVITFGLTVIASWFIIRITTKSRNKAFRKTLYRQSDLHKVMKKFFSQQIVNTLNEEKSSQLTKRKEKDTIKVIVVDEKAYWVSDNVFYTADAVHGNPIPETAQPLDTKQMSNKDISKMLFILDNLKDGELNDSGSTGNERL
jgi:thymidine kinase